MQVSIRHDTKRGLPRERPPGDTSLTPQRGRSIVLTSFTCAILESRRAASAGFVAYSGSPFAKPSSCGGTESGNPETRNPREEFPWPPAFLLSLLLRRDNDVVLFAFAQQQMLEEKQIV